MRRFSAVTLGCGLLASCTFGSTGAGTGAATSLGSTGVETTTSSGPASVETSATTQRGAEDDTTGTPPPPSTDDGVVTDDGAISTTTGTDSSGTGEPPAALCDDTDPDLRGCYDFVGAASGTLMDLSGKGNDGTVTAGVVEGPGPYTSAVRTGPNDSVLVPDSASLDILGPDAAFDAWLWIDSVPPAGERRGVFDKDGQYSIFLYGSTGLRCGFGGVQLFADTFPMAQWFHLACTGSAAGSAMYLDGVLVDEAGVPESGNVANTNDLSILDNSPQLDQPLDGQIASLRIFDRSLSIPEIEAAANAP